MPSTWGTINRPSRGNYYLLKYSLIWFKKVVVGKRCEKSNRKKSNLNYFLSGWLCCEILFFLGKFIRMIKLYKKWMFRMFKPTDFRVNNIKYPYNNHVHLTNSYQLRSSFSDLFYSLVLEYFMPCSQTNNSWLNSTARYVEIYLIYSSKLLLKSIVSNKS